MTIDERLDRRADTVEFVATLQRANGERLEKLMERDAINRLARIADKHDHRIEDREDQRPS